MENVRYPDDHDYMNFVYGGKRTIVRASHTMYMATFFTLLYNMNLDYVSKMRYNKDKDIVFVTRPSGYWTEQEHVYEVHHLEQMVPSPVTAIPDLASNHKNGILTVQCMATNENLKFYKDDKYWNADLRKEFNHETTGLWKDTFACKVNCSLFSAHSFNKGKRHFLENDV